MTKISNLICAVAALFAMASCEKDIENLSPISGKPVEVTINVNGGLSTRASGSYATNESTINSLQVFCFDKTSGLREDYKSVSGATSATLSITTGIKRIYAVANAASLSAVTTENDLINTVTNFADNNLSSFVMVSPAGNDAEKEISGAGNINLIVKRMVAKILVDKITANLDNVYHRSQSLVVNKIYLVNAAQKNNLAGTYSPTEFFSGSQSNGAAVDAMILDSGLSYDITNNGSQTINHGYYVYPNNSVVKTGIVVEATFMGATRVYSFELPEIERNKVYEVTGITITKAITGTDGVNASLNVTVSDWETGSSFPLTF